MRNELTVAIQTW